MALLRELVLLDVDARRRRGMPCQPGDYGTRFPELAPDWLAGQCAEQQPSPGETLPHQTGNGLTRSWPQQDDPVGRVVGDYELLEELGRGSMGVVYRARQVALERICALKMILHGELAGEDALQRFRTEAQVLARLGHPNIVEVYDFGTHNGLPYFSLEFCAGGSLNRKLAGTPVAPREAAALVQTLAQAMQAAHDAKVIHRDLKPANVLLTADGTPKITDFGLAKKLDDVGQTQEGAIMGTPSYMAPEQAQGKKDVGLLSDIYALGAILYECLTGRPPFKAATSFDTIMQVASEEAVPPRQLNARVPADLETICLKCLLKDPDRRYASAADLADDLARFLEGKPIQARPVGALERGWRWCRREPALASLLSAVALLLVAVAVISTVYAVGLDSALRKTEEAEREARTALTSKEEAERKARLREAEALVGQAHGIRSSRRPGQRFEALAALKRAAAIGRELEQPAEWFDRLRNEAIAALALPDIHITQTFPGFPPGTVRAEVSHDFGLYACITKRGACSIRRIADDKEIAYLPDVDPPVVVGFVPGRFLVRHFQRLELWDLNAAKPVRRVNESIPVANWTYRQDGRLLAVEYQNGFIGVYETKTGTRRYRIPGSGFPCLHPTAPIVAVCSWRSRLLQVRDLRSGAVLVSLTLPWPPGACLWSPDGRTLAVVDGNGLKPANLYAFDLTTSSLRLDRTLTGLSGGTQFCFNPAGDLVAACGWDTKTHLFDAVTGRRLFSIPGSVHVCGYLCFDPAGKRLAPASVGQDQIGLWSVAAGRECRVLVHDGPERYSWVSSGPAVHPDGRVVAVQLGVVPDQRTAPGTALFDLESGRELAFIKMAEGGGVPCFDGTGNLFTNGPSGIFRWPVHHDSKRPGRVTFGPREQRPFPAGGDRTISTSLDGKVVAQATWGAGAWGLHPSSRQARQLGTGRYNHVSVSPDGRWIACASWEEDVGIDVFEAATGKRVWHSRKVEPDCCRFSADGRWLLTRDNAGGRAYAVPTWKPGPRLGAGNPFDVSADGRLAVLGQAGGTYRLVEMATGREVARLEDPDQITGPAAFTPDGTRLVVGAEDGLRVWDLRLIRRGLSELGLDWAEPPYPEAVPGAATGPLEVQVLESKAWAHYNLGNALYGQGKVDEAIACFRKAIELDPKFALAHCNLGLALGRLDRFAESLASLKRGHELGTKQPGWPYPSAAWVAGAHNNLGNALKGKGKVDEAIDCYKKAIALDPNQAGAHGNLAWLLATCPDLKWRDPGQALTHASKAVELAPRDGHSLLTLAWAAYRLGKWKEALKAAERALPIRNGGDCADWFLLAMIHWRLGNKEKARQWYDRANRLMLTRHHDDWPRFRAEAAALLGLNDQPPGMKRPGKEELPPQPRTEMRWLP